MQLSFKDYNFYSEKCNIFYIFFLAPLSPILAPCSFFRAPVSMLAPTKAEYKDTALSLLPSRKVAEMVEGGQGEKKIREKN